MAENKLITELSGITNPSLTGYTIYDDGNTTFKLELGELVAYVTTAEGDFTTTSSFNTYTSSLNSFTSSLNIKTGSFATTGSNIFNGSQSIKGSVIIGLSGSIHTNNPEILHVQNSGSFNVSHFEGNSDTYLQHNIKNTNSSAGSSTDFVATADNGTEDLHYVNMGINSSGFDNDFSIGYQNDAYVINRGRDLYIGSLDGPDYNHTHVHLFSSNSWRNPQINIVSEGKIGFNTGSITTGYTYEFSGSIKSQDNLSIDGSLNIGSVNEKIVLLVSGGTTTYELDYNSGSVFYLTSSLSNNVYNVSNIPTDNNQAVSITFIIKQESTPYIASSYKLNNQDISVSWANGDLPTGTPNKTDVIGLTALRVGSSWNILGTFTTFG